jgi:hypothetical protein
MRLWKRLDHDAAGIVCIECGLSQQEAILLVDGHALRIARVVDHEPARAEAERRLPEDHVAETVNVVQAPAVQEELPAHRTRPRFAQSPL